jgi:hypothetical protein
VPEPCHKTLPFLYLFFTHFDFDVGKAGIEEKQKVESRKQKWEGRQAEGGVAWHFLALFGTIWHDLAPRFRARRETGWGEKQKVEHGTTGPQTTDHETTRPEKQKAAR